MRVGVPTMGLLLPAFQNLPLTLESVYNVLCAAQTMLQQNNLRHPRTDTTQTEGTARLRLL